MIHEFEANSFVVKLARAVPGNLFEEALVNVDALDLTGIVREKGFEGEEIVAFDEKIAGARIADGKFRRVLQQVKRHLPVMVFDRFLPYPVQCRHYLLQSLSIMVFNKGELFFQIIHLGIVNNLVVLESPNNTAWGNSRFTGKLCYTGLVSTAHVFRK